MSIQLTDSVNIKKIISDKDYVSLLLIFALVVLLGKAKEAEFIFGVTGVYIFWRGWFLIRKDRKINIQIDKTCTDIITDLKEKAFVNAWVPITKEYIKKFAEDDEVMHKCWERLVSNGYVFYNDDKKEYMFNRSKIL